MPFTSIDSIWYVERWWSTFISEVWISTRMRESKRPKSFLQKMVQLHTRLAAHLFGNDFLCWVFFAPGQFGFELAFTSQKCVPCALHRSARLDAQMSWDLAWRPVLRPPKGEREVCSRAGAVPGPCCSVSTSADWFVILILHLFPFP